MLGCFIIQANFVLCVELNCEEAKICGEFSSPADFGVEEVGGEKAFKMSVNEVQPRTGFLIFA